MCRQPLWPRAQAKPAVTKLSVLIYGTLRPLADCQRGHLTWTCCWQGVSNQPESSQACDCILVYELFFRLHFLIQHLAAYHKHVCCASLEMNNALRQNWRVCRWHCWPAVQAASQTASVCKRTVRVCGVVSESPCVITSLVYIWTDCIVIFSHVIEVHSSASLGGLE